MNEMLASWAVQTRKVEEAIWARLEPFEKRFCHNDDLLEVWFDEIKFKVICFSSEGVTWTHSFPLTELDEFFQDHPI